MSETMMASVHVCIFVQAHKNTVIMYKVAYNIFCHCIIIKSDSRFSVTDTKGNYSGIQIKDALGPGLFVLLREAVEVTPLFRGCKYIGGMLKQAFGTTKSVLWMEVNCYSECPLLEVPLYFYCKICHIIHTKWICTLVCGGGCHSHHSFDTGSTGGFILNS